MKQSKLFPCYSIPMRDYFASKELGTTNYSIYEVIIGKRKSIKGFIFKKS